MHACLAPDQHHLNINTKHSRGSSHFTKDTLGINRTVNSSITIGGNHFTTTRVQCTWQRWRVTLSLYHIYHNYRDICSKFINWIPISAMHIDYSDSYGYLQYYRPRPHLEQSSNPIVLAGQLINLLSVPKHRSSSSHIRAVDMTSLKLYNNV